MLHVKKLWELGRGITGYIRSHLWVSIMGSLMLLFLLVVSFRLDSFAKAFPCCCF